MPKLRFHLRDGGTGTIRSSVDLGLDEGDPVEGEYRQLADATLTKIECRIHFFPDVPVTSEAMFNEARRQVVRELERLRSALNYVPVNVKTLSRGIAVIPNVHDNFGDLVYRTASGDTTILDNCCLMDSGIADDAEAIQGITLNLVFGRVCDAMTP